MLVLLAATVSLGAATLDVKTIELFPTDDVWVYPHASDPTQDEFLRIWGVEGKSVAGKPDDLGTFSYSFLKWSIKDFPNDAKLVSANLVLTQVANPAYTTDDAKQAPIEVRPVPSNFKEKGW